MHEVYAFDWYTTESDIICVAKDLSGETVTLTIWGYEPYCYTKGGGEALLSSNDNSVPRRYTRHQFRSFKELNEFRLRGDALMCGEEQICMFLANNSLEYTGWILVDGTRVHYKDIKRSARETVPQFRVLSFDIEVYTDRIGMPKSYRHDDEIFMIGVTYNYKTVQNIIYKSTVRCDEENYIYCENERDILVAFANLVAEENPDIIVGFNIFNFDFKYIYERMQLHLLNIPNMSRLDEIAVEFREFSWQNASYGNNNFIKPKIPGRAVIDVFQYFKRMNIDRHSLQYISQTFLQEEKYDLNYSDMMKLYKNGVIKEIGKYCAQDAYLVLRLIDKFDILVDLMERARILRCKPEDILTRGEQFKVNHQVMFECIRRNMILEPTHFPPWSEPYEGATVYDPKPGVYADCVILDYQSLYPSVLIVNNICPSTYVKTSKTPEDQYHCVQISENKFHLFRKSPKGILPELLERLLDARASIKQQMKTSDDELRRILDKRQNALKIAANSVYGITGARYSKYLKHRCCAESISGAGRYYFNKLIDYMVTKNQEVIYGDTDSCIISNQSAEAAQQLSAEFSLLLPNPMVLKYEDYYDNIIMLSKKKYIMKQGQKISYKGVANARRGYCEHAKKLYEDVVKLMLLDKKIKPEAVAAFLTRRFDELMAGEIPIEQLVISKSVKDLSEYKSNVPQKVMAERLINDGEVIEAGARLEYVFVKNSHKTQGLKMYRPEELRMNANLEIDYMYYLEKQIANSIDQLLELIGLGEFIATYIQMIRIGKIRIR
jgi:DNA polymerase delta subunit 1